MTQQAWFMARNCILQNDFCVVKIWLPTLLLKLSFGTAKLCRKQKNIWILMKIPLQKSFLSWPSKKLSVIHNRAQVTLNNIIHWKKAQIGYKKHTSEVYIPINYDNNYPQEDSINQDCFHFWASGSWSWKRDSSSSQKPSCCSKAIHLLTRKTSSASHWNQIYHQEELLDVKINVTLYTERALCWQKSRSLWWVSVWIFQKTIE